MSAGTAEPKRVWIDTDPAFGDVNGDCDDGYAMIALLNAENVEVRGISSVFGNTGVDNAQSKIRTLIDGWYAKRISAAPGDNFPLQLNHHKKTADNRAVRSTKASEALIAELELRKKEGSKLHIVAIGSHVNIATVALTRPDLLPNVEQIVIVAGRYGLDDRFVFGNDPSRVFRDLNFDVDPMASIALLGASVPIVLAGVQVARSMWLNNSDLDEFRALSGSPVAWMAEQTDGWINNVWKNLDKPKFGQPKIDGFHPFDLFAAGWIICPQLFTGSARTASIITAADDTEVTDSPPTMYKQYLIADAATETADRFESEAVRLPWRVFFLADTASEFKGRIKSVLMHGPSSR